MNFKNKIEIIHEDKQLLVINKPTGLPVHPSNEHTEDLLSLLDQKLHIINRLDKETSGVVILAKTSEIASEINAIWNTRQVVKEYIGVTRGKWKSKAGKMNQPLTDKAEGRKNPQGKSSGRVACLTEWISLEQTKYFCLLQFILHSGRQHQIRKHCAIENHPLVGDQRYGDKKYNLKIEKIYGFSRQALHCQKITLVQNKKPIEFVAPEPKDFKKLLISRSIEIK